MRDMYRAGLNMLSKVSDVVRVGNLSWPSELGVKHPILKSIDVINVASDTLDKIEWHTNSGAVKPFAVSTVW
ncbi:hypothetical protein Tco_0430650, partial [Tanacetum coccineum]